MKCECWLSHDGDQISRKTVAPSSSFLASTAVVIDLK